MKSRDIGEKNFVKRVLELEMRDQLELALLDFIQLELLHLGVLNL